MKRREVTVNPESIVSFFNATIILIRTAKEREIIARLTGAAEALLFKIKKNKDWQELEIDEAVNELVMVMRNCWDVFSPTEKGRRFAQRILEVMNQQGYIAGINLYAQARELVKKALSQFLAEEK